MASLAASWWAPFRSPHTPRICRYQVAAELERSVHGRRSAAAGRAVEHRDRAPILRPAGDVVADRDRPLLAVADRFHARWGDSLRGEIIVDRLGAAPAKGEIV